MQLDLQAEPLLSASYLKLGHYTAMPAKQSDKRPPTHGMLPDGDSSCYADPKAATRR